MRKLSMATILPLVHFVVYMVIFKGHLFPYQEPTTGIRLWLALNGPVLVILDLAKWTATIPWVSPHIMTGIGPIYFIFLVGGAALWCFVGRALDGLGLPKTPGQMTRTAASGLFNLFVLACGIRLIFSAVHYLLPAYPQQRVSLERTIEGIIVLLWSLFLFGFSLRKLVSVLRHRPARSPILDRT